MKTDFSSFALWTAGLPWLTQAYAYTTPVGDTPSGNPIYTPGLNDIVPVGTPYDITWNPTTSGTVTLVLLRGPSTNVVPLYAIVEKIENTGSYSWTPSSSLEADTTHYGIQLIVDSDGSFQYSTQFGISNSNPSSSSSSLSSSGASTLSAPSSSASVSVADSSKSQSSSSVNGTSYANATTSAPIHASTGFSASNNATLTKSMSVPATLKTSTAATTVGAASASTGATSSATGAAAASAVPSSAAGQIDVRCGGAVAGALVAAVAYGVGAF